jgi:hypothetical protein
MQLMRETVNRNAQAFLRWNFALPETNPLFDEFHRKDRVSAQYCPLAFKVGGDGKSAWLLPPASVTPAESNGGEITCQIPR